MPVSGVGSLETKVFDDLKSSHIALNALTYFHQNQCWRLCLFCGKTGKMGNGGKSH